MIILIFALLGLGACLIMGGIGFIARRYLDLGDIPAQARTAIYVVGTGLILILAAGVIVIVAQVGHQGKYCPTCGQVQP